MTQAPGTREHLNLYHLFAEDQAAHPMPADRAEHLRSLVMEIFTKCKAAQETDPP